jgi:AAA domain
VVIDTLNRSQVGSESSDEDMGNYVKAANAIKEEFECAVIIVHHCGYEGTRPRGHSSLIGALDAQIAVARDAENNIVALVEYMKDGKDGPEGLKLISRLEVVDLGVDDDNDEITSCVVLPVDEGTAGAEADSIRLKPSSWV